MTTDERIDRLVERHEALAQSVEMLTHNVETLTQKTGELRDMTVSVAHDLARLIGTVEHIADATEQLIGGMNNHEVRIRRLEAS
jgi:prefoldin subunit 5